MKFANGDVYTGEYKEGQEDGEGTIVFANGDKYTGNYKDGKRHGSGVYVHANGDKYEGQYEHDKKQKETDTALESKSLLTNLGTRDNGKTTKEMERVSITMLADLFMKVSISYFFVFCFFCFCFYILFIFILFLFYLFYFIYCVRVCFLKESIDL